ncbi:flagellar biosynthetic protein FliO [Pseudomonas sp. HK3]|jgi:flagellar protein FliO/FliZ
MIFVSAQALATAQTAPALASPIVPSSQDQLIQVTLALVVVVALIYAIAWVIKRKQGVQGISNIPMKTIGVLPMGMKEKIILVEVGGKQILLGMTPSNINTLATFDEPIVDETKPQTSFSQKLKDIISQQTSSPDSKSHEVKASHEDNT